MFCINCGTQLPDKAKFCFSCGQAVEGSSAPITSVKPSTTKLVEAKCTNCNAALRVNPEKDAAICPYCNSAFIVEKAINNFMINVNNASLSVENAVINMNNSVNSKNYIDRARKFSSVGSYDEAVNYLITVLDQEPNNKEAQDEIIQVVLAAVKRGNYQTSNYIISLITKVLAYDSDSEHKLLSDVLCYLGAKSERIIEANANEIPISYFLNAKAYYQKARSIHMGRGDIVHALNRVDYILYQYEFFSAKTPLSSVSITVYSDRIEKNRGGRNGLETYYFDKILNVQKGNAEHGDAIFFVYGGKQIGLQVGYFKLERLNQVIKLLMNKSCPTPSADKLVEMGYLTQSGISYSYVNYYNYKDLMSRLDRA